MGYSNSVYKAASDTLHERRLNAEKAAERRKEEVCLLYTSDAADEL